MFFRWGDNEGKRFCCGIEELTDSIEKHDSLNRFFRDNSLMPSDYLFLIREGLIDTFNKKGEMIEPETMREAFSPFIREEFSYLFGGESNTVERRFKKLLEMEAYKYNYNDHLQVLIRWGEWFAPEKYVDNDIYETYDFDRSENVIMYIIDGLGLPPLQSEIVKYYLKNEETQFELTDHETELLKMAGKNLLSCDGSICRKLDEIFKS